MPTGLHNISQRDNVEICYAQCGNVHGVGLAAFVKFGRVFREICVRTYRQTYTLIATLDSAAVDEVKHKTHGDLSQYQRELVTTTETFFLPKGYDFYRAMLCIRGTSHGPVSVCVSVSVSDTSRCSTKTTQRRITQTTPHDSPGTLVFCCQRSPRNSTGVTPYGGAKCRWGGSKSATFDK